MDVSHLLDQLNDEQRDAVCAPASHQLILAGAGSGKTRVLVHRIAWLMQVEGVSAHQILAVTFTNKAAREMRERLQVLMGDHPSMPNVHSMWVGTFHGIAHRLLRAHWQQAGLPQNFQILDGDDQLRLIKRVYQELGLDDSRWPYKQTQWFINGQKDEGVRPEHMPDSHDPFQRAMKQLYTAYQAACERAGVVDFAEILLRSHELWLKQPELLEHYQKRFPFLLVDEFQDTNVVQYAWLRVLAGKHSFVTAVGDDDQSIYGWRGARIENIQTFTEDFGGASTIRLEQNYRSTQTILNAANAVIANNSGRLGKQLWTSGADGEPIDLYAAFNEQDEARYIVERVESWQSQGNPNASVAVLYRSNAQSRVLEEAFLRQGVPYRIYGGQRFYERLEIKNALAYLRLLMNRQDDPAFERVINTPTRGIGTKTVESIRQLAREQGCSMFEAASHMVSHKVLSARATSAVSAFIELLEGLSQSLPEHTLEEQVALVIERSGLKAFHRAEKGERGLARVENLEELVNACRAFEPEDEDSVPLAEFLDTAALDAGETQADEYEDAVQMMTLHSAKGLEFPLVFLAGVEENIFPHRMSSDSPEGLEEERRLCYVGITRAMQKLVITHAESRRLHGSENFNRLSRFVREIPSDLLQEVRLKSSVARQTHYQGWQAPVTDDTTFPLKLGQRVHHPMFGEGTVLQFEGSGASARVQVNFGGEGSKWLVMQYAKLEALS